MKFEINLTIVNLTTFFGIAKNMEIFFTFLCYIQVNIFIKIGILIRILQ